MIPIILFIVFLVLYFLSELPLIFVILSGVLALEEIVIFIVGHVDTKTDRKNREIYKDYQYK